MATAPSSRCSVNAFQAFNLHARQGHDPVFGRGSSTIDQAYGDPAGRLHPNLGPLETPPFYAVRLSTGDIGSLAGLASDEQARVLRGDPLIRFEEG